MPAAAQQLPHTADHTCRASCIQPKPAQHVTSTTRTQKVHEGRRQALTHNAQRGSILSWTCSQACASLTELEAQAKSTSRLRSPFLPLDHWACTVHAALLKLAPWLHGVEQNGISLLGLHCRQQGRAQSSVCTVKTARAYMGLGL